MNYKIVNERDDNGRIVFIDSKSEIRKNVNLIDFFGGQEKEKIIGGENKQEEILFSNKESLKANQTLREFLSN